MDARSIQGVGMANIKTISTVNIPQKWEVAYEVDFTTLNDNFTVDGTPVDLNGIDWKVGNVAFADSVGMSGHSDGLKLKIGASTTNARWITQDQTGPVVFAQLSDIISGLSLEDTISVQVICDFSDSTYGTISDGYFYGGPIVFDGSYGAAQAGKWEHGIWVRTIPAGVNYYMTRYGGGPVAGYGYAIDMVTTANMPTFFEGVIYPGGNVSWAGSEDTDYQTPLSVSTYRAYTSTEANLPKDQTSTTNPGSDPGYTLNHSNLCIGVHAFYFTNSGARASQGGELVATFKKLRVLKRGA